MNIIQDKKVITRNVHSCWGCGRKYPAKTEMRRTVSVDGGEIGSAYWCKVCSEFMDTLDADEAEDGFCPSDLLRYEEHPFNKEKSA